MTNPLKSTAIITGASRGIGSHIARAFAAAGYPVVMVARTSERLEELVVEIEAANGTAISVQADLTLEADRQRVMTSSRSLGPVGVLVNNAAVGPIANFHDQALTDIDAVIALNLMAPIAMARLVAPDMLARGTGRIINVATVAARLPMPYMALYSATKAGLAQFSNALDLEYRHRGIRSATVYPGAVLDEGMSVNAVQDTGIAIPNDGAVKPSVVAKAILDAATSDATNVYLDAGSKFMANHPRIAYPMIKRTGVFDALEQAANRFRDLAVGA